MTAGSALAALALFGLACVNTLGQFYLLWSGGLGLAMALTLYPVTFTVVANWFVYKRGKALAILTLVGGLSSPICIPIAGALVAHSGWRSTLVVLGLAQLAIALPLHALLLRASVMADHFGRRAYGAITAVQGIPVAVCAGLGPLAAGWLYDGLHQYEVSFWMCASAFLLAASASLSRHALRPSRPAPRRRVRRWMNTSSRAGGEQGERMEMRPFGENAVSLRASINMRGVHTMMPPDIMSFLQQQRRRKMQQQAGRAVSATKKGRSVCLP